MTALIIIVVVLLALQVLGIAALLYMVVKTDRRLGRHWTGPKK
jgi:hypothetical protein